jgi:hypothetical protein
MKKESVSVTIEALEKEKVTAEGLGCHTLAMRCQEAIDKLRTPSRKASRANSSKRGRNRTGKR